MSGTIQCYIYSNSPDGSSANILRCSDWTTIDNDSKLAILKSSTSFGPVFIHGIDIKVSTDYSCSAPHTRAELQHGQLTNNWVEHVGGFFTYTKANNAIICSTGAPGGTRKACHLTKKGRDRVHVPHSTFTAFLRARNDLTVCDGPINLQLSH